MTADPCRHSPKARPEPPGEDVPADSGGGQMRSAAGLFRTRRRFSGSRGRPRLPHNGGNAERPQQSRGTKGPGFVGVPRRKPCDGDRAVLRRGRDDVSCSFFSPGQSPSTMEDLLDVENKRMADSLASKVTRLKSLALDIDKDAEEQNRYLDGMDSDFLSVTGLLTGSVKRFSGMARSGRDNRRLLLAVSAALILIFFILYYLVSRAGT
ncbi:PREDICTED: BET1-like protein [Ficedula albicollis]|uniref:BET1-like protein n=2 Tax=Muscicapidae TaxID=36291 RepID=UPI00035A2BB8|nr:PREDICTED: BET1-like protein [Ficedula albicollis]